MNYLTMLVNSNLFLFFFFLLRYQIYAAYIRFDYNFMLFIYRFTSKEKNIKTDNF